VVVEVENTADKLKSGMNAQVEITLFKKEEVLLIPLIALQRGEMPDGEANEREVLIKRGTDFIGQKVQIGSSNFKDAEIISGLSEGDILGIPMTSRLKAENERLEKMIKRSRSFGGGKKKPKTKKR
jgi:multidrug efflux pump subunit AcrA (membrane-fusion protein)